MSSVAEILEKYFDVAFAAPDGIKKLRELILSLAMQGKLVPQDPNDQPARELLQEIEAEKERLVKEGKIKQSKPLPEIKPDEVPYDLPKGWEWVRLDHIVSKIGSGSTPRGGKESYLTEGIPFLRSQNIWNDGIRLDDVAFISEKTHDKMSATTVISMDILLNITGASIGRCAIVPDNFKEANVSQHVTIIRCVRPDIRRFTHGMFISPYGQSMIWSRQVGMSREGLSKKVLEQFQVPIPPLAEQQRIVAKIDELMGRCDELEKLRSDRTQKQTTVHSAALDRLLNAKEQNDFNTAWQFLTQHFSELYSTKANLNELRKAILQLAVMGKLVPQDPLDRPASELLQEIEKEKERLVREGKIKKSKPLPEINPDEIPHDLPKCWEWVRVIDLVDVGTGSTPATTNSEYYNGNIPWYTSSATNDSVAKTPETFITEQALKETNCKVFPSGSLIIAMYGQGKTRGQISEIVLAGATNQAIAAMVFYESSKSLKKYIKYYFVKIYEEIRSIAEGAAQPNLNVGKIKETLIPLPPLAEQHHIVAKIDQLMTLCDNLEKQIDAANSKQTSLLNALMTKV